MSLPRLRGEVLGYRQWIVTDDLRLSSATSRGVWEPGENVARCILPDRGAIYSIYSLGSELTPEPRPCEHSPGVDCDCGLYALHAPTFWYGGSHQYSANGGHVTVTIGATGGGYVAGLVVGWGEIEVHASGWRAERARVAAIAVPESKRAAALARAIAAEYAVPTVPQAELAGVASEFGVPVPRDMLPEVSGSAADPFAASRLVPSAVGSSWHSSMHYLPPPSLRAFEPAPSRITRPTWRSALVCTLLVAALVAFTLLAPDVPWYTHWAVCIGSGALAGLALAKWEEAAAR